MGQRVYKTVRVGVCWLFQPATNNESFRFLVSEFSFHPAISSQSHLFFFLYKRYRFISVMFNLWDTGCCGRPSCYGEWSFHRVFFFEGGNYFYALQMHSKASGQVVTTLYGVTFKHNVPIPTKKLKWDMGTEKSGIGYLIRLLLLMIETTVGQQ